MAHLRILFVGGRANLDQIFADAPDSSSESAAELTIGADWIADYDWLSDDEKKTNYTTEDFTKTDTELYKQILNGEWSYCYDIRDTKKYGHFDCMNCKDFEPYIDDKDWIKRDMRNKKRIIRDIQTLPDDTLFHFAEAHW